MKRGSLRLPDADGDLAQSAPCSQLGNNNELETEKEQLCAEGDSPVHGAKITPLVLFINSGGTGSDQHTDVGTAGPAGTTCPGTRLPRCGAALGSRIPPTAGILPWCSASPPEEGVGERGVKTGKEKPFFIIYERTQNERDGDSS